MTHQTLVVLLPFATAAVHPIYPSILNDEVRMFFLSLLSYQFIHYQYELSASLSALKLLLLDFVREITP
jgi:hypothetical protein